MCTLTCGVIYPPTDATTGQDEEYVVIDFPTKRERIRLHDYAAIYEIPGLYEKIFYERLQCRSPDVVCSMLTTVLEESGQTLTGHRVLDFGAGNGIVGEKVKKLGCKLLVGVDILEEARAASDRDRPGVYDYYYVADLTSDSDEVRCLQEHRFDTMVTVSALGFDDIPPDAFLNAFNLVEDEGWVAFNIKDRFLTKEDSTGFSSMLHHISNDALQVHQTKRYCHRLSLSGEKLIYIAVVGQKIKDVGKWHPAFEGCY